MQNYKKQILLKNWFLIAEHNHKTILDIKTKWSKKATINHIKMQDNEYITKMFKYLINKREL